MQTKGESHIMKQSKIDTRYLPLAAMILRMMEEDGVIKRHAKLRKDRICEMAGILPKQKD